MGLSRDAGGDVGTIVRAASRDDLIAAWRGAYRRPPPTGISRHLLELAAAWSLQAKRQGGLTRAARTRLKRLAEGGNEVRSVRPRPAIASGTRLARTWNGRTHVVDVTDDGFIYGGETYRSLSAVARRITGARWSGPRFFGLDGCGEA